LSFTTRFLFFNKSFPDMNQSTIAWLTSAFSIPNYWTGTLIDELLEHYRTLPTNFKLITSLYELTSSLDHIPPSGG